MKQHYDYIIVGAGSAGCVLADRRVRAVSTQYYCWKRVVRIRVFSSKCQQHFRTR